MGGPDQPRGALARDRHPQPGSDGIVGDDAASDALDVAIRASRAWLGSLPTRDVNATADVDQVTATLSRPFPVSRRRRPR